jgi:hypothetical protein
MLMRVDNARIEFPPIGPNVKRYGNWVGGTLCIGDEGLLFHMNAANKLFQKNTEPVCISRECIKTVTLGKMLLFFTTVDVKLAGGTVRFRGYKSAEMRTQLQALVDHEA